MEGQNHPCVLWGACFLWLVSIIAIIWSLALFFCVGDMLLVTGTDVVIALILLSGVIMFPTNVYMLYTIGNGQKISHKSRVLCCPLWMLIIWIIVINSLGLILCFQRICMVNTMDFIVQSMKHYRSVPRYKHFMDNLQWSLKCCGLDSYKDWFNYDWFEKIRDYEWNPLQKLNKESNKFTKTVADSVPLSCCKSGTCVPNYLLELGTHSIHTKGCSKFMYRIYMTLMNVHLVVFFAIVVAEISILTCIIAGSRDVSENGKVFSGEKQYNVKHLMPVNNKFLQSSSSTSVCFEDGCGELSDFELKRFDEDQQECFQ